IDGMFQTASEERRIASIPWSPDWVSQDFGSTFCRKGAMARWGAFVSRVHPRLPDKRVATDIVGAVRGPDRAVIGYIGISVLVERIGRRLSAIEFADQSICEVFDQSGSAIFAKDFQPNPGVISP